MKRTKYNKKYWKKLAESLDEQHQDLLMEYHFALKCIENLEEHRDYYKEKALDLEQRLMRRGSL